MTLRRHDFDRKKPPPLGGFLSINFQTIWHLSFIIFLLVLKPQNFSTKPVSKHLNSSNSLVHFKFITACCQGKWESRRIAWMCTCLRVCRVVVGWQTCNTLQHTATHCSTLLSYKCSCSVLQCVAVRCRDGSGSSSFILPRQATSKRYDKPRVKI